MENVGTIQKLENGINGQLRGENNPPGRLQVDYFFLLNDSMAIRIIIFRCHYDRGDNRLNRC